MKKQILISCLPLLSIALAAPVVANPLADLASAAETGTVTGGIRYRFETVEQENALIDASASTFKGRLTFKSGTVNGLSSLLELDYVGAMGPENYNSTTNGKGTYSVVADPLGADVNQAFIKYTGTAGDLTLGRQRIALGDQRYIGGVAWRQNEQTFNGVTYDFKNSSFSASYSYVTGVNRIFAGSGNSAQAEHFDSDSHFLTLNKGALSAFVYALDFENAAAASSLTYGASYKKAFSDLTLTGAIAQQSDYGDNATEYSAMYYSLAGEYKLDKVKLMAGYEVMGSDDGVANFSTPLATLHKWDGWADVFLGTGTSTGFTDGIEDLSIGISGTLKGIALSATYHDFNGNNSGNDLGTELDANAVYKFTDKVNLELKYAGYSADSFSVDTTKMWMTVNWSF